MRYLQSPAVGVAAILITLSSLLLHGCGGQKHQTEEQFLDSLHGGEGTEDGTMPPVDKPFENVAHIRVETNEMDVGVIENDKPHHTKLTVYNDGKMPLKLTRVDTTCACTQGFIAPENAEIPPGGSAWIDVVIDPYRIPAFDSHKVLTITSTDPMRPQVEVGVAAHVQPEFEVDMDSPDSEEVDFGEIPKGSSVTKHVRLRQLQDAPITISKIEPLTDRPTLPKIPGASGTFVEVPESEWKTPGKREFDIAMTLGPELPAGPFERYLFVHMDVPRVKQFRLAARGTVMAPYAVVPLYPQRATLAIDKDESKIVAHASVKASSMVTITDIVSDNENVIAALQPSSFPNEVGLDFTLSESAGPESIDSVVRFKVSVNGQVYDEFVGVRLDLPPALGAAHAEGDGHDH